MPELAGNEYKLDFLTVRAVKWQYVNEMSKNRLYTRFRLIRGRGIQRRQNESCNSNPNLKKRDL